MRQYKGFLSKRLSKRLKVLRGGVTQVEFCKKLGISVASLNRLETASQNVSLATLEKLCINLDCEIADLFLTEKGGKVS